MTKLKTVDLLVIGGGLGGLLAAAHAQKHGRSTLVLEQTAEAGGFGKSPALGGMPMNLGPHALYLGGIAERVLTEVGVTLAGFEPGSGSWLQWEGALIPMPSSAKALLQASWLTWRERFELALVLRRLSKGAPKGPVSQWLATLHSPRVRAFVATILRVSTYTNAPEVLPTSLAWRQMNRVVSPHARGVRYLDGGWQSLVDQLNTKVSIQRNSRAIEVSTQGVVRLESGETVRGSQVALAVPLATAAKLTGEEGLTQRASSSVPVRAACLDVVLSGLPQPERRIVLGMDEPVYFSVHSAPQETRNIKIHVAWYLGADDKTESSILKKKLSDFLSTVQPGWETVCEEQRFFPHLKVMEDVPREYVTRLASPLKLVSTVATNQFLFDGVVESIL